MLNLLGQRNGSGKMAGIVESLMQFASLLQARKSATDYVRQIFFGTGQRQANLPYLACLSHRKHLASAINERQNCYP
jgi:hypothetical protein